MCIRDSDKIMRNPGVIAADREFEIREHVPDAEIVNQWQWLSAFLSSGNALVEGSQGYSLGISSGFYPHCTSRDCTPSRVVADASLPMSWVRHVYGSCRVHPIRVGNTAEGSSGGWYKDQKEITWLLYTSHSRIVRIRSNAPRKKAQIS